MTKQRPTPKIIESSKDFYYDHPLTAAYAVGLVGAVSVVAVLSGVNGCVQPKIWKEAITQAVRADGFSDARYSFLPDVFDRSKAKTTLLYAGCELEGVTLSLVYQNGYLADVSSYDFSTAERAIEKGVLPATIGSTTHAKELGRRISLQMCVR